MFCKQCGTRNDSGSKFCEACGATMGVPGQNHGMRPKELNQARPVNKPQSSARLQRPERQDKKDNRRKKKPIMILIGILSLVLVLLVGWVFMGQQTTRAFNDAIEAGNRYLLEENLEQAEVHFLRAIDINPREVEPYLSLADIYMELDRPEDAIDILERGLEAVTERDRPALEEALDEVHESIGREPAEDEIEVEEEEDVPRFRVEWVLEPSIEADDINYVRIEWPWGFDYFVNDAYRQYTSSFAVIQQGEIFGLIGNDGNMLSEMNYSNIFHHSGGRLQDGSLPQGGTYFLAFIEPDLSVPHIPHHVPVNGQLEIGFTASGAGVWSKFYYYNGLRLVAFATQDLVPNHPIPVMGTNRILDAPSLEPGLGLYGVFYQGMMQTEFIYTRMGSWSEGLMAAERDGRWGYINERGEVIIPIEFDASFIMPTQGFGGHLGDFAYAASEGFVPLVKDGVWEMRTITNEQVIEPGVFEAIRPMMFGRSWVRYNGLWGVIEIIENEDPGASETEEEEGSLDLDLYAMYREVFERYQGRSDLQYGFYDIDGNGIPELLLYSSEQRWYGSDQGLGITHIFTWRDGQVTRLFTPSERVWCGSLRIYVEEGTGVYVYNTGYIKERLIMNIRQNDYRIYRISPTDASLLHVGTIGTGTTGGRVWYTYNGESITESEYHAIMARYTNHDLGDRDSVWSSWESNINIQWRPMP